MRPVLALALSLSLAACGGAAATTKLASAPTQTPAPPAAAARPAPAPETASAGALRRSAVRSAVKGGLGLFLQKVELDDQPVMVAGRFHGFRIAALHDQGFWTGVDLRPGDVVVRVNGMPIEHPEEALEAFRALEIASDLRIQYERDGKGRELHFPIVDDEPQKRADASAP